MTKKPPKPPQRAPNLPETRAWPSVTPTPVGQRASAPLENSEAARPQAQPEPFAYGFPAPAHSTPAMSTQGPMPRVGSAIDEESGEDEEARHASVKDHRAK
ncbi:hypothetical protein QCA50_018065 [Cerrena zonata]|uniref:Uncharacterized protein n=1 Tax=Cerrena zonata TaxID=2478898 RepID=A0AAW0FQC1_9APHY